MLISPLLKHLKHIAELWGLQQSNRGNYGGKTLANDCQQSPICLTLLWEQPKVQAMANTSKCLRDRLKIVYLHRGTDDLKIETPEYSH